MFRYIICKYIEITIFLFNKNLYSKDEAPFILNADKIINNNDKSLIIAEGNVEIIQGNEVLRADFLKFDRIKNKAFAKGNVSILDKDGVVYFADYAEVDKGFKNGLTKNISILFPDNSKMAASKGKRFKGQISRLKNVKKRPLLDQDSLEESVNKIYSQRKKIYNKSNFKIKCNLMSVDQIVDKIVRLYESSENKI